MDLSLALPSSVHSVSVRALGTTRWLGIPAASGGTVCLKGEGLRVWYEEQGEYPPPSPPSPPSFPLGESFGDECGFPHAWGASSRTLEGVRVRDVLDSENLWKKLIPGRRIKWTVKDIFFYVLSKVTRNRKQDVDWNRKLHLLIRMLCWANKGSQGTRN